jgi:hypothetical protein
MPNPPTLVRNTSDAITPGNRTDGSHGSSQNHAWSDVSENRRRCDHLLESIACGERIHSIKTAWRATCRRAGIRNLHFHDLRREFASRLRESGASDHDVRDFLGHANISTTSRYLKSTPQRLERALANMEASVIRTPFAQTSESAPTADAQEAVTNALKVLIQ